MHKFSGRAGSNSIDTEINEFGELTSLEAGHGNTRIYYKRFADWRVVQKKFYKTTGIHALGTTYPCPYDREDMIKREFSPIHWYCKPAATVIITLLAIIIDCCCYYNLFKGDRNSYSSSSPFAMFLAVIGAAVAIDVLPIFLAHNLYRIRKLQVLRKDKSNINHDNFKLGVLYIFSLLSLALFIVIIAVIFVFRTLDDDPDEQIFWLHILISSVPIATSCVCFIVGYLSYDPISKKLQEFKIQQLFLQENINEAQAMLAELAAQPDYYQILKAEDDVLYNAAIMRINSIGDFYKTYARTSIIPYLKSPADTTDLTAPRSITTPPEIKFPLDCDAFYMTYYQQQASDYNAAQKNTHTTTVK